MAHMIVQNDADQPSKNLISCRWEVLSSIFSELSYISDKYGAVYKSMSLPRRNAKKKLVVQCWMAVNKKQMVKQYKFFPHKHPPKKKELAWNLKTNSEEEILGIIAYHVSA